MAKAKPTPAQTHEPLLWPVVGRDLETLRAIADGLALVHSILGNDANAGIALHSSQASLRKPATWSAPSASSLKSSWNVRRMLGATDRGTPSGPRLSNPSTQR